MTPVHPHELSPAAPNPDDVGLHIHEHLACPGCGYDLIGLRYRERCPECGRVITFIEPSAQDEGAVSELIDAPVSYIATMQLGYLVMVGALLLGLASAFGAAMGVGAGGALIAALLWLGGLALVARQRPRAEGAPLRREPEWWQLRLLTLLSQSAWVVAAALGWAIASPSSGSAPFPGTPGAAGAPAQPFGVDALYVVMLVCVGVGLAGWVPTTMLLARYADWTRDGDLAMRLRGAAVSMGISGPILAAYLLLPPFSYTLWMVMRAWSWLLWIVLLISVGLFLWSILSQIVTCANAVSNAKDRLSRDKRMVEKMRAEAEAHMRAVAKMPEITPPDPFHTVGTPRGPIPPRKKGR